MTKMSSLSTKWVVAITFGITLSLFSSLDSFAESAATLFMLVLILCMIKEIRESANKELQRWFYLAWGCYGLGLIADVLDEFPHLENSLLIENADDPLQYIGLFLICFCFLKMLAGRNDLITELHKEIAHNKSLEQNLYYLANHDELTSLKNRRALFDYLKNQLTEKQDGHLVYMDLDHFKRLNDHFGHQQGDEALKEMAMLLLRHNNNEATFRLGGDEFVAVLSPTTNPQQWIKQLHQLSLQLTQHYHIGISAGYYSYQYQELEKPDHILALADQYMYHDKHLRAPAAE